MTRNSTDSAEREASLGYDETDDNESPQPSSSAAQAKNKSVPAATTAAQRRDQNRIAQREFRQRKQQKIRDLEARVELLSGGKDEIVLELRGLLRDLMAENQQLRQLLRGVTGFIGDGAGGLLPKLGWDMSDFERFINRSETDTVYEAHQLRKKGVDTSLNLNGNLKRPTPPVNIQADASKRRRGSDVPDKASDSIPFGSSLLSHSNTSVNELGSGLASFSDLLQQNGTPVYGIPNQSYNAGPSSSSGPIFPNTPFTVSPTMRMSSTIPSPPTNFPGSAASNGASQTSPPTATQERETDPKIEEAYKLMAYHLENYQRNDRYCLPASLRPTTVQKTVPHEAAIDRVLHPELRDRMILLRGRFEVAETLWDYRHNIVIHGDDVLLHANWEISESWLKTYSFLVDGATLAICNKWRAERGDPPVILSDVDPSRTDST